MEFPDAETIAGTLGPVEFPEFATLGYDPPTPEYDDPRAAAREAVGDLPLGELPAGATVAVGLGNRGISDVVPIARTTVDELLKQGFEPIIVPAMGSHGGATPRASARHSRASDSPRKHSAARSTPAWRWRRSTMTNRSTSHGGPRGRRHPRGQPG